MTRIEIANDVIKRSGGIAKTSDFLAAGLDRTHLTKLCQDGVLTRIRYGLYQLADNFDISEAEYISAVFPEGIVCLYSALFYYGYSDFTPREWSIAFPRTVSQRKMKGGIVPMKPYYYQNEHFEIGKATGLFDGTSLAVYDRERTICDCFKYRTKMDNEIFAKAINAYVADKNKNLTNLSKYAKSLKVYKKVTDMMEVLLNG